MSLKFTGTWELVNGRRILWYINPENFDITISDYETGEEFEIPVSELIEGVKEYKENEDFCLSGCVDASQLKSNKDFKYEDDEDDLHMTKVGWVSGPKWAGLFDFLKQSAIDYYVDLIITDRDKRWITETIYYKVSGIRENVVGWNSYVEKRLRICNED